MQQVRLLAMFAVDIKYGILKTYLIRLIFPFVNKLLYGKNKQMKHIDQYLIDKRKVGELWRLHY